MKDLWQHLTNEDEQVTMTLGEHLKAAADDDADDDDITQKTHGKQRSEEPLKSHGTFGYENRENCSTGYADEISWHSIENP